MMIGVLAIEIILLLKSRLLNPQSAAAHALKH